MKIRVYDSDGEYRGGLFKTAIFNSRTCRMWHLPPKGSYREHLIDIAGLGKPCQRDTWYRLMMARKPELSGPSDGSDSFDAASQAIRISAAEARKWLRRHGFTPPPDLVKLLARRRARKATSVVTAAKIDPLKDPSDLHMPARWFADEYGIKSARLRAAWRSKRLQAFKIHGRLRYSVKGAQVLWPEERIDLARAMPSGD